MGHGGLGFRAGWGSRSGKVEVLEGTGRYSCNLPRRFLKEWVVLMTGGDVVLKGAKKIEWWMVNVQITFASAFDSLPHIVGPLANACELRNSRLVRR